MTNFGISEGVVLCLFTNTYIFGRGCKLLSVVYIFECELGKPDADIVMDGRLPEASVRPEVGRNSLAQARAD